MITDNLDNIEVCRLGFWWAVGGVVGPAMLLWQEIWSISCRVSPSYSISTTTNNHQLGSGPDHLSLGNKEGDNSQWEAFYLNSAASSRWISSLGLPATVLDTSRLFRRNDGQFTWTDWDFYYLIGLHWPGLASQCDRPGLAVTFLLGSRQETWKTYQSHLSSEQCSEDLSHHIIRWRQLLSNNCFLLPQFMADKYSLEQKNYFDTCQPKLKSIYLLVFAKNNYNCNCNLLP